MAKFAKKTTLGYKLVEGGSSNSECTHVILTLDEYDGLKREISSAQQAAKNAEYNADKKIHQIQSEAQSRITDAEKKIAKNTAEWEKKLAAEQQESALQRGLNANLLRITKERANAERDLKPKKEHTGYVVLTSVEKESRYQHINCTHDRGHKLSDLANAGQPAAHNSGNQNYHNDSPNKLRGSESVSKGSYCGFRLKCGHHKDGAK